MVTKNDLPAHIRLFFLLDTECFTYKIIILINSSFGRSMYFVTSIDYHFRKL